MTSPKKGGPAANGGKKMEGEKQGSPSNSTASTAGLEVTATHAGFRRAGLVWSDKPTRVKLSDLSDEQVTMLKGCPGLRVGEVDLADAAEKGE